MLLNVISKFDREVSCLETTFGLLLLNWRIMDHGSVTFCSPMDLACCAELISGYMQSCNNHFYLVYCFCRNMPSHLRHKQLNLALVNLRMWFFRLLVLHSGSSLLQVPFLSFLLCHLATISYVSS